MRVRTKSPQVAEAAALVRQARQELESGNIDSAKELAQKAASLDATYGTFDDRPELILADLDRASNRAIIAKKRAERMVPEDLSPEGRHEQAAKLLESARADLAEGFVGRGADEGAAGGAAQAAYGEGEDRPEQVLADLARVIRARNVDATELASATAAEQRVAPAVAKRDADLRDRRWPFRRSRRDQPRRQLLPQRQTGAGVGGPARRALEAGDLDLARELAQKAEQLDAVYGAFDDRPELLMADLDRASSDAVIAKAPAAKPAATGTEPADAAASGEAVAATEPGTTEPGTPAEMPAEESGDLRDSAPRTAALPAPTNPQTRPRPPTASRSRRLMEAGELRSGASQAEQAADIAVAFDVLEDTPELVLAEIEKTRQIANRGGAPRNSEELGPQGRVLQDTEVAMTDGEIPDEPAEGLVTADGALEAPPAIDAEGLTALEMYTRDSSPCGTRTVPPPTNGSSPPSGRANNSTPTARPSCSSSCGSCHRAKAACDWPRRKSRTRISRRRRGTVPRR